MKFFTYNGVRYTYAGTIEMQCGSKLHGGDVRKYTCLLGYNRHKDTILVRPMLPKGSRSLPHATSTYRLSKVIGEQEAYRKLGYHNLLNGPVYTLATFLDRKDKHRPRKRSSKRTTSMVRRGSRS